MEHITILKFFTLAVGFYMAWNIGANDVANAMGTSVGSKALTLKRAVILAAILEFSGAFFVGSDVSKTIQQGLVDPNMFTHNPMIFVYGMLGALFATGLWLQVASYFGLPVSTTHAIVGAVVGFGAIVGGMKAVFWGQVFFISVSWILSPILSAAISYTLFRILQQKILFAFNPLEATKKIAPIFVFFAFFIFSLSLMFNGLENMHLDLSFPKASLFSLGIATIALIISSFFFRKIQIDQFQACEHHHPGQVISLEKAIKHLQRVKLSSKKETRETTSLILKQVRELTDKVKEKTHFSKRISTFAEVEGTFVYLQIISACLVAFAHGANDVANAIGPVAAVFQTLKTGAIQAESSVPFFLLILGGAGIVIGLATWGWRVIETIGKKITELTPTRGFCAEFGAATTILIASKMGLPISTTHALVGSVLGVGLARGIQAINLKVLKDIVLSWIITIPACAFLSIVIFFILRALFI